jgi:acyl-CoA hydrolase
MRHARSDVVTGAMDSVAFLSKVRVGDVLTLSGRINAAFGSSMEVEVSVHAEDPRSGRTQLTTTALVTMVAVDGSGRPTPVAKLRLESEEEHLRSDEAHARRRARLAERT